MKGDHPVRLLCELLEVSTSGYYRRQQNRPSKRQRDDAAIGQQIATAHKASRGTYGVPRILKDLKEAGTRTSKRRCARLTGSQGLRGKKKNRRRPRTTDSRHAEPVAANLLAKASAPTGPNRIWWTDIRLLGHALNRWQNAMPQAEFFVGPAYTLG